MDIAPKNCLVTGASGFIGFHLSKRLLESRMSVVGIDNMNAYYDVNLKEARLERLRPFEEFTFYKCDLTDKPAMDAVFENGRFDVVVNLAAQAGVRHSLEKPSSYVNSNLVGFANILECCRRHNTQHLVFASSSSVYGANTQLPFSVHHNVDYPVSLYAATKKANELMAHAYSHLYHLPCTGLRFFTVYGPWGRPDMAPFLFSKAILAGEPIKVFNHGKMRRDFTYIDDIVEGVLRVMEKMPEANPTWNGKTPDPSSSYAPYKIYNIGNSQPIELIDFINTLQKALNMEAKIEFLDMQPGDVEATYADVDDLVNDVGFKPETPLDIGIRRFIDWYIPYHKK